MTETLAHGYSSESAQRVLSNEYQHDRVKMFFKNVCIHMLWTKVASALEGLTCHVLPVQSVAPPSGKSQYYTQIGVPGQCLSFCEISTAMKI